MAENVIRAHIFGRRRVGDKEEAQLLLYNEDGSIFIPAGGWSAIRKSIDESVVSNNVVQDDDELQFRTKANRAYEIELLVIYSSESDLADLKCELSEDATTRGEIMWIGLSAQNAAQMLTTTDVGGATAIFGSATTKRIARGLAHHVGGGGLFKFRWSQNLSKAFPTVVHEGSVLRFREIS